MYSWRNAVRDGRQKLQLQILSICVNPVTSHPPSVGLRNTLRGDLRPRVAIVIFIPQIRVTHGQSQSKNIDEFQTLVRSNCVKLLFQNITTLN
ncbi:hypothetical protein BDR05DRAFT_968590 [Suillus weaverae]|nr:hypothetical protein BDR05DRAFT_968590 [Suillus weaverae]